MPPPEKSVLIVTVPPVLGGITNQSRLTADLLAGRGYAPTLAWRAYYGEYPELSVPSWRFGRGRPSVREVDGWPYPRLAVGTWLPEFEWAHHNDWQPWSAVLDRFRYHVVVSGNNLSGYGLVEHKLPSLQWIASGYRAERVDRYRTRSLPRRLFNALLNEPVTVRQERRILENAETIAISNYTLNSLRALTPRNRVRGIVHIPVDSARFSPAAGAGASGRRLRIGINGRLSDPRKNTQLLVDAFRIVARQRADVDLVVRSDLDREEFLRALNGHDLADRLDIAGPVPFAALPDFYRSLDVFAISSWQEGLSVTGTEAMACGATVVSTRCGGPEEFILDGETGRLSGFEPADFAGRLLEALDDAAGPRRLAEAGIGYIRAHFSRAGFEETFLEHFSRTFAR
jgi:glycosyltransferase involved in cell wall biosynthesis